MISFTMVGGYTEDIKKLSKLGGMEYDLYHKLVHNSHKNLIVP